MEQINNKIKAILKKRGSSVSWLCQHIDMTDNGYFYMMQKETLKVAVLQKIAQVMEVPIAHFILDETDGDDALDVRGQYIRQAIHLLESKNESYKKEIELLKNTVKDKEEIISLMKNNN